MEWIEDLIAAIVAALVRRDDRMLVNDFDAINVCFHRNGVKRTLPWNAVADVVETCELVLIDFDFLSHTRIK